jgi:PAS domain S-box-containing protein
MARETLVVADTTNDPRLSESVRNAWLGANVAAAIATSLIKDGKMVANFGLHNAKARQWSEHEVRLVEEVADRTWAAAEQSRAEAALRESKERQAFMLELSDALRPLSDPTAIQEKACQILGGHLSVNWTQYSEVNVDRGKISNVRDFFRGDLPSHVGEYDLRNYPVHLKFWTAGQSLAIDDVAKDTVLSDAERTGLLDHAVASALTVPLLKNGSVVAVMAVLNAKPRRWSGLERALVEETADRTWAAVERGRAEQALRESEERFKQFAEASASGLWIRDAETLAMEYTSPALARLYGVEQNALLGELRLWASLVIPEDRDVALKHLEDARIGQSVVHEFRIQRPSDQHFRWIRSTDFPLRDAGKILRLGGIAEDVTETRMAVEHQGVLLHELQHRVRNIMAMIRSTALRSADSAADVDDYKTSLSGRLLALARVQTLLTRQANAGGSLRDILESEIGARTGPFGKSV